MPELPLMARLYVVAVVASACVLIGFAVYHRPAAMDIVVMLAVLHIVGESLLARGSRDMLSISLGSVTSLAAIPMVGGWGAILVAWTAAFALDREPTPMVKRLFNGAMLALAAGAAGGVYALLNGDRGRNCGPQASPVSWVRCWLPTSCTVPSTALSSRSLSVSTSEFRRS